MLKVGPRTRKFVALLQALAMVLGLQLSGVLPLAKEAASLLIAEISGEHDCCRSEPERCHDCAPGCPDCHCPSHLRSLLPAPGMELVAATAARVIPGAAASRAPPGPELPAVFRPPRTADVG